jgi:hypothetical protein
LQLFFIPLKVIYNLDQLQRLIIQFSFKKLKNKNFLNKKKKKNTRVVEPLHGRSESGRTTPKGHGGGHQIAKWGG